MPRLLYALRQPCPFNKTSFLLIHLKQRPLAKDDAMLVHLSCRRRGESDRGPPASRPRNNGHRKAQVPEVLVHPRRYRPRTLHHRALLPSMCQTATFLPSMERILKSMSDVSARIAGYLLFGMVRLCVQSVSQLHPLYPGGIRTTVS